MTRRVDHGPQEPAPGLPDERRRARDRSRNEILQAADIPSDPRFSQTYSALGVPMHPASWWQQDRIDEGRLWRCASRVFGVRQQEALSAWLHDPNSLPTQEQLLEEYLREASADPAGVLLLEMMPTNMDPTQIVFSLPDSVLDQLGSKGANDFRVCPQTNRIRGYHLRVAQALRQRKRHVYAWVVPYSNTVENVLSRRARPEDAADNLSALLERIPPSLGTVGVGYSQGASALRVHMERPGRSLDYVVMLATMGGVHLDGSEGLYAGRVGRSRILSVVHEQDPARFIYGEGLIALLPSLLNFVDPRARLRGGQSVIHGAWYGSPDFPIDPAQIVGVDTQHLPPHAVHQALLEAASEAGTFGYPNAYVGALAGRLFAGAADHSVRRRATWNMDLRQELVLNGQDGPLDPTRLRQDPDTLARSLLG